MPRVTDLKKKINDLESRLSAAQEEAKLALNKTNDNEQYSRKYNLRFIGIEEKKDEICTELIVAFCKEKLRIVVPANTIDRAHQVGKKSEGKTRAILVKFMNNNSKLWFVFRKNF